LGRTTLPAQKQKPKQVQVRKKKAGSRYPAGASLFPFFTTACFIFELSLSFSHVSTPSAWRMADHLILHITPAPHALRLLHPILILCALGLALVFVLEPEVWCVPISSNSFGCSGRVLSW
jgi:hypothetical protein